MHVERAFVICLHFLLAVYVKLQCPAGEWIHVVHEAYGDGGAGTCLKSAGSCNKLRASSKQGLVVNCNGKQSCHEAMQLPPINNCNITAAAAEVKYNCIKGSMNMCSSVTTTVNGSVYLHSPGFPDSVGVNSSCVVRITGQTLQVTLVEKRMRSGILNISGDGRQLRTYVDQYNRILPGHAAEIAIIYDNHDQDGTHLWIKVADSGQMNITISGETLNASTTPTSTQQPSQSTSGPSTSDTPTTETAASTQSTAIVAASFTAVKSTHGLKTHSTTVSTAVSTTEIRLIVWIVSAVSGCVVTILIVVIAVVLCRKHVKKNRPLETPGKGHFERPSELSSINTEKHHNGFGQNETCNQYFVLYSEFGARGGQSLNTEPGHTETSLKNKQDQYAKALPLGSTVDMYDKSTFTVTNSEADNGAPNVIRDPNGGMADNDQGKCGMTENYFHSKQVWKSNCEMMENDVYDGGPHAANENSVDDSYGVGLETNVGMVDNGLYDKFDFDRQKESVQDESDTSPNNSKQSWKDDCEMIENDVYDGGPPHLDESDTSPSKSKKAWKNDCDMVENDVYQGGPL